jgi:hypothetical protein
VGRDSPVGIATRYGLEGPGIESRWVARFSAAVQTGPGTHPPSCMMGTGSFPEVNRPGCGNDHPATSTVEVKERVRLYLYSHSEPSWSALEWTLYLLVTSYLVTYCTQPSPLIGLLQFIFLHSLLVHRVLSLNTTTLVLNYCIRINAYK